MVTAAEVKELLRAVASVAGDLRASGVTELELDGPVRRILMSPPLPVIAPARPAADEAPADAMDDPATYGLPQGSALPTPDANAYVLGGGWVPQVGRRTPRGRTAGGIGPDDLEDIDPP